MAHFKFMLDRGVNRLKRQANLSFHPHQMRETCIHFRRGWEAERKSEAPGRRGVRQNQMFLAKQNPLNPPLKGNGLQKPCLAGFCPT